MTIDFYYQNIRGIRTKTDTFYKNNIALDMDVMCLTETWLNSDILDSELVTDEYTIYRKDRNYEQSRTSSSNLDYETHLNKIKENFTIIETESKILILGDYNLPSIKWVDNHGSLIPITTHSSSPSGELINTLNYCNLSQINHTISTHGTTLALVMSNFMEDRVTLTQSDISVLPCDLYHPVLVLSIKSTHISMDDHIKKKLNFFKANYQQINSELMAINWDFLNNLETNLATEKLYLILNNLIKKYVPIQYKGRKYPPWFSTEVITLIKRKNRARLRSRKKPNNVNLNQEFKRLRNEVKNMLEIHHNNFIENLQDNMKTNIKAFWAYAKSKKQKNTYPHEFKHENRTTSDVKEICEFFSLYFQSTYTSNNNIPPARIATPSGPTTDVSQIHIIEISAHDITSSLEKLDKNKSGGPDAIPNVFLKSTAQGLSTPLRIIYNKSLSSGIFPNLFKTAYITPIFKSGNKSQINNYRPICIQNSIAKLFEKIIHNKLYNQVARIITQNQHGFMK